MRACRGAPPARAASNHTERQSGGSAASAIPAGAFDPGCRHCPRLADHLAGVREGYPDYHAAPVPPFGVADPGLLVVGLAPGMHGANATGRPFTGDHAGLLLYRTLHAFGFSNGPESVAADDGLELHDCRVTNAVKCLPPQNKPTGAEVRACNPFLAAELAGLRAGAVVLALGRVAHDAVVRATGARIGAYPFAHGRHHDLASGRETGHRWTLIDCYHCSRYNTQTRRLTEPMFRAVFEDIERLLQR